MKTKKKSALQSVIERAMKANDGKERVDHVELQEYPVNGNANNVRLAVSARSQGYARGVLLQYCHTPYERAVVMRAFNECVSVNSGLFCLYYWPNKEYVKDE